MKTIKWKNIEVDVNKIKPTPNNFKLRTEDGMERFLTSMKSFGLAGSVILNADFTLIDGNTRWEQAKKDGHHKIWASIPNRCLTPKEFSEFSALYDYARAGAVDVLRIKKELGNTAAFFKKWGLEMPNDSLEALANLEKADGKIIATKQSLDKPKEDLNTTQPLTLLFTGQENKEFMRKAESLYGRYKVDNVTDLVYKVFTKVKL